MTPPPKPSPKLFDVLLFDLALLSARGFEAKMNATRRVQFEGPLVPSREVL